MSMLLRVGLPALLVFAVAAVIVGCSGGRYFAAPSRLALVDEAGNHPGAREAYGRLRSPLGPTRFSQVTPSLYRGGQPDDAQLAELATLGVRTVVSLRDTPEVVATERVEAEKLGMRFLNFPFSGLDDPDPQLMVKIIAALREGTADGAVYVHCQAGRDRTSLVVALYRVWVEGWRPSLAWQHEADDYGHSGWRHVFFRKLDRGFFRLTQR